MSSTATVPEASSLISPIRKASREVVREWGYLRSNVANLPLSFPAVHALVEIGAGNNSPHNLAAILCTSTAITDLAIAELVTGGLINHDPSALVPLSLTPAGVSTLAMIDTHGSEKVRRALEQMGGGQADAVLAGLQTYAEALKGVGEVVDWGTAKRAVMEAKGEEVVVETREVAVEQDVIQDKTRTEIVIEEGYRPGLLGRTLELHMGFYPGKYGFGWEFEAELAVGMSAVLKRVSEGRAFAWTAVERDMDASSGSDTHGKMVGMVFLDGEVDATPGEARVRCYIVDGETRGKGVGRKLMIAMMDYVRSREDLHTVILHTIRGLDSAIRLYETSGFVKIWEGDKTRWGKTTRHLKYEWKRA